jgi:hypothetical protein
MLKKLIPFLTFMFIFSMYPSVSYASDVCESPQELHKKKMERFMMKDIPSILDDCGLGQLLNFCNNPYLKLIGKAMGLCGGVDIGIGDFSSNFCGIGFKIPDINSIYISQRKEILNKTPLNGVHEENVEMIAKKYVESEQSKTSAKTDTVITASTDDIKNALGI